MRDELAWRDAILAGESEAAERFVERHAPPLYRFVHYRLSEDPSAVEDVVQETFLVAIERLEDFDGRASLEAWLTGIARNRIRSRRRQRKPRPLADVLEQSDPEIWDLLARVSVEPLPDWVLESVETAELVGATLSSLPDDYASALVAKYVEGRTTAELARTARRSVKATESLLGRARLAFGRVFELLSRRRGGLDGPSPSETPIGPGRDA